MNRDETPQFSHFADDDDGPFHDHAGSPPQLRDTIFQVVTSLQRLLERLMDDKTDVQIQGRYVPRVGSTILQAIRILHQTGSDTSQGLIDQIEEMVRKVEAQGRPEYTAFTGDDMP